MPNTKLGTTQESMPVDSESAKSFIHNEMVSFMK